MGVDLHGVDIYVVIALFAAAAAVWMLKQREIVRGFILWRTATIAALLLVLFQPEIVRSGGDRRPSLAVAFDTSGSMRLSGRMSSSAYFLKQNLGELERDFRLHPYRFDANAREGFPTADAGSAPGGPVTDLARSLWEIRREGGDGLSGIVLLSDGNQTGDALPPRWLQELNVPVFPVEVGVRKKVKDCGIEALRIGDFAFKNTPVEVTTRVRASACAGEKTQVVLKRVKPDERVLATRPVAFASDADAQDVTLSMTPDASGTFDYRVELQPLKGEVTRANNAKTFTLSVLREKLRVLYICGQPGPEYAFLRQALKSDPVVELVSFVILRNPESIALVPENDLSLIPFPVHTIFTRDLFDFDMLVLENFSYRRFGFLPDYFSNIRKWVLERGGGLVMIGGQNAFGAGGWNETAVGDILPLGAREPGTKFDEASFRPRIAVFEHPVMRLADDPARSEAIWRGIPELDGCQVLDAKQGASVLAEQPWNGGPVIAVWEKGKGRALALASNTTWRWALGSQTPEAYGRFWKNVVRYVTHAQDAKKVLAQFDRPEYAAGQNFSVMLRSAEKYPGCEMRVSLTEPSGKRTDLPVARGSDGSWSLKGTFAEQGNYRFKVSLEKSGATIFGDTLAVNVMPSTALEESALDLNEPLLREIASATGGEYLTADTFSAKRLLPRLKRGEEKAAGRRKAVWDSPLALLLIAGSFLGEWFMRRRKGLV